MNAFFFSASWTLRKSERARPFFAFAASETETPSPLPRPPFRPPFLRKKQEKEIAEMLIYRVNVFSRPGSGRKRARGGVPVRMQTAAAFRKKACRAMMRQACFAPPIGRVPRSQKARTQRQGAKHAREHAVAQRKRRGSRRKAARGRWKTWKKQQNNAP